MLEVKLVFSPGHVLVLLPSCKGSSETDLDSQNAPCRESCSSVREKRKVREKDRRVRMNLIPFFKTQ
jgi:hypothetical protein